MHNQSAMAVDHTTQRVNQHIVTVEVGHQQVELVVVVVLRKVMVRERRLGKPIVRNSGMIQEK